MAKWHRGRAVVVVTDVSDCSTEQTQREDQEECLSVRVLSLAEAYFSLDEEHMLSLPACLSLHDVWCDFQRASPVFVANYITLLHYRRLGWVLRPGLNYGAQFVLYRGDPDVFHSEYIVHVSSGHDGLFWHAVQALTRLAEDVKKTVLLCQVTHTDLLALDDSVVDADATSSLTHGQYTVHGQVYELDAVLIRYWDPTDVDKDRETYAFAAQPTVHKKNRNATKKKKKTPSKKKMETKSSHDTIDPKH